MTKRLVCLANSRKFSGRCIAGKDVESGEWIRPVSARPSQEVSEYERNYSDGSSPAVLDVIDVPVLEPRPKGYQSENWLLDPTYYWARSGIASLARLRRILDTPGSLWINGMSSKVGTNDRVDTKTAAGLSNSLYLIDIGAGNLQVFAPGAAFGDPKRRVQLEFEYGGNPYSLWVTDPVIEREYLARPDGRYAIGPSLLTVSLGEPHAGYAYKLVAAVVPATSGPVR